MSISVVAQHLREAKRFIAFTGAGVCVESGNVQRPTHDWARERLNKGANEL